MGTLLVKLLELVFRQDHALHLAQTQVSHSRNLMKSCLQAGVYELVRDDGTVDKVKVLKAKHKYALMTKMQREWEVGRRISSLKNPERAMPGYMSVGAAVCTEHGNFKGKPEHCHTFPLCISMMLSASIKGRGSQVHCTELNSQRLMLSCRNGS